MIVKWQLIQLGILLTVFITVTGCVRPGPNSFGIAQMSARELTVVSDTDLCHAQRFWRSPQMMNEISRRNLDCNAVATKRSTTPTTTKNGSKNFQESAKTATDSKASLESATPVCDTSSTPLATFKPGLPEYYGVYVTSRYGYVELKPMVVANRFGLTVGDLGQAVDGFDRSPSLSIKETNPAFLIYSQGVDVSEIRLSPLICVGNRSAYEFNIQNTDPAFFYNVYRRNYNDIIEINLWQANGMIKLRVAPVSGKQDMYHLVPVSSLAPGRYALYMSTNLHQYNMIFSASLARQTSAFYFEVQP